MVNMYFPDDPALPTVVVNWIFLFRVAVVVDPVKQLLALQLDLAAVPEKVDTVVTFVQETLQTYPAIYPPLPLDDRIGASTCGALLSVSC